MSQSSLAEDLAYVRQMAEEGAAAPSLSGRFSTWWAGLVTIALFAHWGTLTERLPIAPEQIGLIWISFAVIGTLGNIFLSFSLRGKPGALAPGNRVSRAIWGVTTAGLFLYGTSLGFGVALRGLPYILFDTIMPLAFILHAVNSSATAILFQRRLSWTTIIPSLVTAAACTWLIGTASTYLVAMAGVIIAWLIPAIGTLRSEPKSVV